MVSSDCQKNETVNASMCSGILSSPTLFLIHNQVFITFKYPLKISVFFRDGTWAAATKWTHKSQFVLIFQFSLIVSKQFNCFIPTQLFSKLFNSLIRLFTQLKLEGYDECLPQVTFQTPSRKLSKTTLNSPVPDRFSCRV